jgi:hypothetical protein
MRYVKSSLVLRLNRSLSPQQLVEINETFADILSRGRFEQVAALSAEQDETHLADKPRLIFHFNRRNLGRLRQLIGYLNRC